MSKRIYLGIDVSKGHDDFLLLDSEKVNIMDSYQLDDTFESHAKLYKWLSMEFKDKTIKNVPSIFLLELWQ